MQATNWFVQMPWFAWIALAAIVGGIVDSTVKSIIRHRERMAMIAQGLHPDDAPEKEAGCCGGGRKRHATSNGFAVDPAHKTNLPEL